MDLLAKVTYTNCLTNNNFIEDAGNFLLLPIRFLTDQLKNQFSDNPKSIINKKITLIQLPNSEFKIKVIGNNEKTGTRIIRNNPLMHLIVLFDCFVLAIPSLFFGGLFKLISAFSEEVRLKHKAADGTITKEENSRLIEILKSKSIKKIVSTELKNIHPSKAMDAARQVFNSEEKNNAEGCLELVLNYSHIK